MPVWATSILTAVLKTAVDFLKGWYADEAAKENEWAARTREAQLKALKDVKELELRIKRTPAPVPTTPAEWNRGA